MVDLDAADLVRAVADEFVGPGVEHRVRQRRQEVRRLLAVGAVLALATVFTCSYLWGEAGDQAPKQVRNAALPGEREVLNEDLARDKFAKQKALAYQNADGDVLFALQVKHDLKPAAPRPRTYVILVDTSASKGMGPLESAKKLAGAVVGLTYPLRSTPKGGAPEKEGLLAGVVRSTLAGG